MKSHILEFKIIDKDNFDEIKSGTKIIETRAVSPDYLLIEDGDSLIFKCGDETISKKIYKIKIFKGVDEMVNEIPFNSIMPNVKSVDEMKDVYFSYKGYRDRLNKFGIIAFFLTNTN